MQASILERAMALNNQGAATALFPDRHADSGDDVTATSVRSRGLSFFQQALVMLRTALCPAAGAGGVTNEALPSSENHVVAASTNDSGCLVVNPYPTDMRIVDGLAAVHHFESEGGHFVFLRPLMISLVSVTTCHPTDECTAEDWASEFFLASKVILFNLALAWHGAGIHQPHGNSSTLLSKASQIYDVILRCLSSDVLDESAHPILIVIYCLVLNNRASLYHDEGDFVRAHECLDMMRRALVLVLSNVSSTSSGNSSSLCGILHPMEAQELLGNSMMVHALLPATAVAA